MRKRRTFSLARIGLWPSKHHESSCTRLSIGAAMKHSRGGRSSRLSLMLFVFIIFNSVWIMTAGAAPVTAVSSHTGNGAVSRTPLSRCPAIFNPMVANINAGSVGSSAKSSETGKRKATESSSLPSCRIFLRERFGTLTTPGFPSAFPVPFTCSWIIDATGFEPDSFITLYLTQMYLTRGVKAVQYTFNNTTHAIGRKDLDELHTFRPRPYSVYRIKARYLEVQVNLDELVNANLRVERRLMDVYGFNITYEIQPNGSRIRTDTCNVANCTFNGHCYANHNYSQFQCSCLPDFSGKYCQYGPECNPEKGINVCKNEGVCGYRTGVTVVRCSCPPNYNGSLCEFRREFIPAKECLSKFRLNCSHHCVITDKGTAACRCPQHQALRSDNLTCYPLVPLRILGHVELDRPSSFNDTRLVDAVTSALKKMAEEFTAFLLVVGSVNLAGPNSNRLQFILWNSEKYNMSWTNVAQQHGPVMAAARSGAVASILNRSATGYGFPWIGGKKRMPRNVAPFTYIPQQWNNSFTSFVHQINSRIWKVQGESIVIRNISIVQVPALIIEWVKLDVKGQVREGYPFTVACNANGSGKKDLKMGWYKDGHPIDDSFALQRNMSIFVHQQQDLRGFFTLYLEVKQASLFDRGEFECRAKDWGQTARKSVFLDVITPPILDLMPINPVVLPGAAVNLTCRDENHLARRSTTKYVWLKNGQPIESSCEEIIEDLTPVGSLLKITSIQLSTNYTCRGENGTKVVNKTTQIFVTSQEKACPQQKSQGVGWLRTAVDITNYQFCPAGYVGVAKRHCFAVKELPGDGGEALPAIRKFWSWGEPDFSNCSDRELTEIYRQLKLITLGYVVTDVTSIINKFADFIQLKLKGINRLANPKKTLNEEATPSPYLPGEGNALLEIAMSLETFLWRRTEVLSHSFWNSTAVRYLYALDALLSMPQDIFRLDSSLPILRFIQNHLTLLGISPKGGDLIGSIESHLLKNSDFDVDYDRKQFKYKGLLPVSPSQTGFKNLRQLAPAQFFLNKPNGYNISIDFHSIEQLQIKGGEYLCALLPLQPTNHSQGWDMGSCFIERLSDPAAFRCHCAHQGTVVLLYAVRDIEETENSVVNLWKVIYFAASVSHLAVVFGLVTLCAMWYQRRCVWLWFQIQVGVSLLPPSSIYFLQTNVVPNPFLTILLTASTYQYAATVWAMIMYLKMSATQGPVEQATAGKMSHNNIRLVGLSLGVPLTLSGVQTLIKEFSVGTPSTSWISQLTSFSGIFFSLVYCTLFVTVLSLYVTSTRETDDSVEKSNTFTKNVPRVMGNNVRYSHCCPILALLGVMVTGSMLCRFHWLSLSTHCVAAFLHLVAVLLAIAVMFTFSGANDVFVYWCFWRRRKLPEGDTVSELLNATTMVESPQRKSLLSTEQHPSEGLEISNRTRQTSRPSLEGTPFPVPNGTRRFYRSGPASSPLLQRAGLGPDVVRAFSLEQESGHQLLGNASTGRQSDISPARKIIGHEDLTKSNRNRINSTTTSDGMQPDDLDSGFGPSGGGGSQKFYGLDKFSDAWKFLGRIRWKLPQFGFSSNGSTSGGGSFRSRQSTMSSATTADFGGERGGSVTTEETEIPIRDAEDLESLTAPYRLRRSRTRWSEDYGQGNELDCSEVSNLTLKAKPFRGRCFIRCSPEKNGSNVLWSHRCQEVDATNRQTRWMPLQHTCCERCWHNPETPICELCLADNTPAQLRSGTLLVRAVVENPPKLPNKDVCEYLEMDPAGSLAIDQQRAKRIQVYYNTTIKPEPRTKNIEESNRANKDKMIGSTSFIKSSCASPCLSRQKKIIRWRIMKKYRLSLRNVVHSTQQQLQQRKLNETGSTDFPAERLTLRDQIVSEFLASPIEY
uniref:Brain-specific angiogenesis inhibitor n=1 Tax=Daphnia magna TaxID=35525 RepID=A0A0P6GFS4_9CRUS